MEPSLLATKLRIPPRLQRVVDRARLVDTLERGIPQYKLILISAPPGYGKTTLLAQWAQASRFPIAWLSLGDEDNDLERFLRYLLAAWEQVQPGVKESPLGMLLGAISPNSHAVLSAFINVADEASDDLVFVLDDYHLIEEPAIHQALTFLLDHLPPVVHFVLAVRADPPLPLARYRARRELLEVRAEDLQFLPEEAASFLGHVMRLDLSHDEVLTLQARLEGWIGGLQLAALTLRRRAPGAATPFISGKHRFVADYLGEEVLARLPVTQQEFLLQTSILDRLCGPLCDAVTGGDGGQEMLELLERENLFLVPLDDSREWFRFHGLFADFLREELKRRHPTEVAVFHRRAARWYLAHDLPEPAFRHAVEGDDASLATEIVEGYVHVKLFRGELTVVRRWLESLPEAWYADHPELRLAEAAFLFFTGRFDACARCLDEVEQRLRAITGEEPRPLLARVTAVRCFMACYHNDLPRAEALAHQALEDLPEDDLVFRPGIYGSLGDTYRKNGRWGEAREWYLKTFAFSHAPVPRIESVHAFGALADLDLTQGHLKEAAAYWRRALVVIQDQATQGSYSLPVIGWVYIRLAEVLCEWNEMATAWDHLRPGLERVELGGDVRGMIAGYLIGARLKLAEGDLAATEQYLERARPLVENAPFPDWIDRLERLQLEFWLAQGRLQEAAGWADEMLRSEAVEGPPASEAARLAVARVLIARGDASSTERALGLLQHLPETAEAEGRMGVTIEAGALQALACWARGERASAMIALERALRLAEPEGYVRLFTDFGLSMARLLNEAHNRHVMTEYVEKLLAVASVGSAFPTAVKATLLEPLSPREQEVLQLIAAGLTNREIAEALVISPETVKKHTGSIYGKLGVPNRTGAVTKARELDLLN